jgi:hypothetical protein
MKKFSLKLIVAFLILGIAFTGCNDDDDDFGNGPDDTTISIDAAQSFNMKNFAKSFEQLFASYDRWQLSFTHNYVNGKALETYMNYKIYGAIGNKAATIIHSYDNKGVIISSVRNGVALEDDDTVVFTYKYDLKGFIVQMTKTEDGSVRDIVNFEYNNLNQLIKKSHISTSGKPSAKEVSKTARGDFDEIFTYDANGNVVKYERSSWDDGTNYEYKYVNNNMVKETRNSSGYTNETNYDYDSSNRVIKEYPNDVTDWYREFSYTEDTMSRYSYDGNRLETQRDYIEGLLYSKYWYYNYDYQNNYAFKYCSTKEFFYVDGYYDSLVSKKEYFEGTVDNLLLVGYVVVNTRDAANEYKKTKESIYNATGTLIYYVEYEVSNNEIQSHQTYLPNGTAIQDYDIDDIYMWIEELISDINVS